MWNTGTVRINPQKSKSLDFTTTSIGIRPWHKTPFTSSPLLLYRPRSPPRRREFQTSHPCRTTIPLIDLEGVKTHVRELRTFFTVVLWLSILSKNKQNKETPGQHSLLPSSRRSTPTRPNFHTPSCRSAKEVKLQALLI